KLVTVTVMLVLSGAHDFVLGPRAGRLEAGSPEALRLRRQAALMARVNGLVALVLIRAAMRLARSTPRAPRLHYTARRPADIASDVSNGADGTAEAGSAYQDQGPD